MKQTLECPKCQSHDIVHLAHVVDGAGSRDNHGEDFNDAAYPERSVRRHLAIEMRAETGLFSKKTELHPRALRCPTEAYVCANCGYFEEYVVDVASVDWSKIYRASRVR